MVIDEILKRNELTKVDGRAIYEYEVTRDEYHALRDAIRARASRSAYGWSNREAAEFCIYIAEWWRRAYAGGTPNYNDVLETLAMSDWAVTSRQSWPRDLIERGLDYLQRELILLGNTQYLGTLATEGGLPLNLLDKDGTNLRRAFQSIFSDLSIYGASYQDAETLGKRGVSFLSQTFQRVSTLPRLLGTIALVIWKYAQLVDEQGDALSALNTNHPGWKNELPLRIDDAQAQGFLNQIFGDAQEERQKMPVAIHVQRRLIKTSDTTWQLSAFVELPTKIFSAQLANSLGVDKSALPYHLTFRAGSAHNNVLFASASCHKEAYRVESTHQDIGSGSQAAGTLRLVAFDGLNEFAVSKTPLAESLDDGPWIFTTPSAETPLELLGTGSIRTRQESVLIAVDPDGYFEPDTDSAHEFLGRLQDLNRDLYLVLGQVCFVDSDQTRWRIRCEQEVDALFEVAVRGERHNFEHARGFPVYGDRLSVQVDHLRVPMDDWHWKSDADEVSWHHAPFGDGRLRLYDGENNVIFQRKACRLPDQASIRYVPGTQQKNGHLILEHFGGVEVGSADPAFQLDRHGDATKLVVAPRFCGEEGESAPANFPLHIRWQQSGTTTQLTLPFPADQARFVACGKVLPHRSAWNAHALDQIRAEFSAFNTPNCKPTVVGRLYADDVTPALQEAVEFEAPLYPEFVGARPTGRYLLPLARIRSYIDLALAGTMSLDARVELSLEWSGCSLGDKKRLALYRYEGGIKRSPANRFTLTSNQVTPSCAHSVEIYAFRFRDPSELHKLVATTDNEWLAADATFQPGTWCVVGTQNGELSHRPHIFSVEGDTPKDAWSQVCESPDRNKRRAQFRRLYSEMAEELTHEAWSRLPAVFEAAKQLPATTFDALDCLIEVPRATAVALVKAGSHRIERWWSELNELPFAWYLISMADWAHAFKRYGESIQAQLMGTGIAYQPQQHFSPVTSYTERQLGGPSPLFAYLNEKYDLALEISSQDLQIARIDDKLVRQLLHDEFRDLLSRKNPDDFQWPQWRPEIKLDDIQLFNHLRFDTRSSWRQPLVDAPVLAAVACVTDLRLERPDVLRIRRLRDFDTRWFDQCYRITSARALAALESHPNITKSSSPVKV